MRSLLAAGVVLACVLLLIDAMTTGAPLNIVLVVCGALMAVLALVPGDLRRRIDLAIFLSGAVTVCVPAAVLLLRQVVPFTALQPPNLFGLAECAGLGLLLVRATRELGLRSGWVRVALLAGVVLALPVRLLEPRAIGAVIALTFCVLLAVGLGAFLRVADSGRRRDEGDARREVRLGLARDLHDSVAHHVTGIVVRAQAGQVVATRDPRMVVETLAAIEREGAESLAAMRRLVGVLREPDAPRQPVVGLREIADLVGRFSEDGLDARLWVSEAAAAHAPPPEVTVTVHRVVQEALTNVRRHAVDARRVLVSIDRVADALQISVTDDGGARPAAPPAGGTSGFGLIGLSERVTILGGRFHAGPQPQGGFCLVAKLPLVRTA